MNCLFSINLIRYINIYHININYCAMEYNDNKNNIKNNNDNDNNNYIDYKIDYDFINHNQDNKDI